MQVSATKSPLVRQHVDAWVLFALDGKILLPSSKDPIISRLRRMATSWVKDDPSRTDALQTNLLPTWEAIPAKHILVVGLGKKAELDAVTLERATTAALRAARTSAATCAVSLDATKGLCDLSPSAVAALLTQAFFAGNYDYLPKDRKKAKSRRLFLADVPQKELSGIRSAVREAVIVGDSLNEVRDIANLSGNEATPQSIAAASRRLAKKYGLTCKVLGKAELKKERCHALLAVGQGSRNGSRLIVLKHTPPKNKTRKPLVLVGKTITFDTGGISLKPPKSMWWMKYDKSGGMAVLATMVIAARTQAPYPVVGLLPTAENMPGGAAYKPGDVINSRAGKTIEVLNTDAEGRLAMADALSYAEKFKPAALVDVATLTGAAVVALGNVMAPVMGNDEELINKLRTAGGQSRERLWPLPLTPAYAQALKSDFADLKNIGDGTAGCIAAGAFLQSFAPGNTPWAHIDVAGTAWEEKSRPYCAPGVTLFGARLLYEWIRQYS